jgi:ubiquitin-like modifier-activating enzyme ATG7
MQYAPYASDIELPFYTALASHKINHDKLDDSARSVLGLYEIRSTDADNASCRIQIHGNALVNTEYVPRESYACIPDTCMICVVYSRRLS